MTVWKWFCFILVALDAISWLMEKANNNNVFVSNGERTGSCIGIILGIVARGYFLVNIAKYWLA